MTTFQRNLLITCLSLGIVAVTMIFQNCGEDGFQAKYYAELVKHANDYPSPFEDNKVVFDKSFQATTPYSTFQVAGKTVKSTYLEPGEEVVIFVDNRCAERNCERHPDSLSCKAWAQGKPIEELDHQAYTLALNQGITEHELSQKVEQSPEAEECLVGLTNNALMHHSGTVQSNDPMAVSGEQPYLDAIGVWDSWEYFNQGRSQYSQLYVAVVDSGYNEGHEDMGRASPKANYSGVGESSDVSDCTGHGSFVNGIINASRDNELGITGVAQGSIYGVLKAFTCGHSTPVADVVNAIYIASLWACNVQRTGVINLSLGGTSGESALRESISNALSRNCLVVVSAGNDGEDLDSYPYFPASLADDYQGVVAVASTNNNFELSSFSNYSNSIVEIAAPGEDILSLSHVGNSYLTGSGTSYSAPMVAAVAALASEKLYRAGLSLNPGMLEEILLRGSSSDVGLENYVKDGKKLDMVAMQSYLESFLTNMNAPQIGLGEPIPINAGFEIPVTFSRGANDYTIELVERQGGAPTVLDTYTIQSTYGSLDFRIGVYRPEKAYEIILKDAEGAIVATYPLPDSFFFKPDIENMPILGKVHQVYQAGRPSYNTNYPEWVIEGWACIEQFPEAIEIEVWKNGRSVGEGGNLEDTIVANQRARGDFYEECKDSEGNPHPMIDLGFFYQPRYHENNQQEGTLWYFKAIHPKNPDLNRWLAPVGDIRLPYYYINTAAHVQVTNVTKNSGEIRIQGYACSYQRNENLTVSLVVDRSDLLNQIIDVQYNDEQGQTQNLQAYKVTGYGNRGGCSRSLPYPETGAVCSYRDIDGMTRVFQDMIPREDRSRFQLKSVETGLTPSPLPPSNCYRRNSAGFDIRITDFTSVFNASYILGDLPPGATDIVTPTTQEQAAAVLLNSTLYLEVKDSRPFSRPRKVNIP